MALIKTEYAEYVSDLHRLPELLNEALGLDAEFKALAATFIDKNHALFLGAAAITRLRWKVR